MTRKVLGEMLLAHAHCTSDGDVYTPGDGTDVDIYVTIGDTLLTIKAQRFSLETEVLVVDSKDGTFVVAYEDVRAMRTSKPAGRLGYGAARG
jgi:hypothetical protein